MTAPMAGIAIGAIDQRLQLLRRWRHRTAHAGRRRCARDEHSAPWLPGPRSFRWVKVNEPTGSWGVLADGGRSFGYRICTTTLPLGSAQREVVQRFLGLLSKGNTLSITAPDALRLEELADLGELIAVGACEQERVSRRPAASRAALSCGSSARTPTFRRTFARRSARAKATSSGHRPARRALPPRLQNAEGLLDRVAADGAQHRVIAAQHCLELLLPVVDHLVGAQTSHQLRHCPCWWSWPPWRRASLANWMAKVPMPPAPRRNEDASARHADRHAPAAPAEDVRPTIGIDAACTKSRLAGFSAAARLGHDSELGRSSPCPGSKMLAKTASPGLKRVTRLPTSVTTPARSLPIVAGSWNFTTALKSPVGNHVVDRVSRSPRGPGPATRRASTCRARNLGEPDPGRLAIAFEGECFHGGTGPGSGVGRLAGLGELECLNDDGHHLQSQVFDDER